MKTFFANKLNYLVILLLSAAIGIVGFLGYTYLNVSKDVVVPDFLGKNKSEVFDWCGQLDPKYSCEIVYEKSRSVQKDLVFQQSINAGSPLKDKITITISSELEQPLMLPQLYNTGKEDIEKWQKENGVENVTIVYENSDTVNKDAIIRIEPSENIFKDTPVTVYISSGRANASDDKIEVKSGEYTNLTVSAFESQVKALGLKPNHNTAKDDYSTSVTKGNIVWHGSGTYENGETINYGICLDQKKDASVSTDITVAKGQYVGKTESDFKKIATDLGLKPVHLTERDAYSDDVAKGNIVTHGNGTYEKGEDFNYGLSLGKKDGSSASSEVYVEYGTYLNISEADFKKKATELKLIATHKESKDAYSDTVAKGYIVWHGSGTYKTNDSSDPFNYGLSLGKKDDSSSSSEIIVTNGQYVGKTESEFKTIATNLGLKANHLSSRDTYSDTIAKGSIVTHGYGTYEKNEDFNYGLSLGKKDGSSTSTVINVTNGQYVGKKESEFKTTATGLGLNPVHNADWDAYSDTVTKGYIVRHGYGEYEKGENFRYGLSLGKKDGDSSSTEIYISSGKYIGKSESEFQTIATGLNLKPNHNSDRDAYSESVAKGYIVWHGSGTYVKDETFNYGLSLGKAPDTTVTVADKSGSSEESFKSYIVSLGLKAGTRSEEYSDSVSAGNLIRNDTGSFKKGASVNYTVSLGKKETPSGNIMRPEKYQVGDTYDSTKQKMQSYLSVFTNVEYIGVTSTKGVGRLEKIEVGSAGSSYSAGSYPVDTPIKVYIVNKQQN